MNGNWYKMLSFPVPYPFPPAILAKSSKEALLLYAQYTGLFEGGWEIEPFEKNWALVMRDKDGRELASIYAAIHL